MDYEAIVDYIVKTGGVTVVEVKRILETQGVAASGDLMLYWPYQPVVIWAGASSELQDVLQRLVADDRIDVYPTENLTYVIDGEALTLPLATVASVERRHPYKGDRWLPVVFNKA